MPLQGLYGVLAYLVTQRTSEIGIRLALGAPREQVLRLMLLDGLRPALVGLILGLGSSAAVVRLIRSMLYETQPLDPAVFLSVTIALLLVAALACLMPAWRASGSIPCTRSEQNSRHPRRSYERAVHKEKGQASPAF